MLSALKKSAAQPLIAKKQQSVGKALTSWKKGSAIAAGHELAWLFLCADNPKIARSIVDEIAGNVVFANNYNVWGPAANAICCAARLAREAKDTKRANALMARIVETPAYHVSTGLDFFDETIARYTRQLASAATEKRAATACTYAANSAATFVYFAETTRAGGFPYDKHFRVKQLDKLLADCTSVLRARVAG